MFTGLVEGTGEVMDIRGERLQIKARGLAGGVEPGDSVAVNGVCLTVGCIEGVVLTFHVMPETYRCTGLDDLMEGDPVNLERAMTAGTRFGGHIVQGHVDGVGEVVGMKEEDGAQLWEFMAPSDVLRYTVQKGSICVDGVSLTVVSVTDETFTVSVLPQTRDMTNLGVRGVGDRVNLEADILGKYVEKLLEKRSVSDAV